VTTAGITPPPINWAAKRPVLIGRADNMTEGQLSAAHINTVDGGGSYPGTRICATVGGGRHEVTDQRSARHQRWQQILAQVVHTIDPRGRLVHNLCCGGVILNRPQGPIKNVIAATIGRNKVHAQLGGDNAATSLESPGELIRVLQMIPALGTSGHIVAC